MASVIVLKQIFHVNKMVSFIFVHPFRKVIHIYLNVDQITTSRKEMIY